MTKLAMRFAVTLALVGAFAVGSQLAAQDKAAPPPNTPSQEQPSPQTGVVPDQTQAAKAFIGKIVKEGSNLVLKDMSNDVTYQLDDQQKAKQYVGQEVKVTGSLDASSNTIHVENIETSS